MCNDLFVFNCYIESQFLERTDDIITSESCITLLRGCSGEVIFVLLIQQVNNKRHR